ncbi:MAG: c-type cytochrome, partial [Chitinophagaceae bacterium]
AGNRYSDLTQITPENIKNLKVAWIYNSDTTAIHNTWKSIQCQPLVINGVLYGTSPEIDLFALDAATGEELWKFKPSRGNEKFNNNRGVMYWEKGTDKRILFTAGSFLYAIDATTGLAIRTFGTDGRVDLHTGLDNGMDHDVKLLSVVSSSPGVIFKNTLILGSAVSEAGDAAPGHIRAFDVITGKLNWVFHTIPQPGETGYETWPKDAYKKIGGANNWSGMSLDEKRGIVYLGTGSPASDFYGGDRHGKNLFANCILALNAETGKLKWYYQTIYHDLWDRDLSNPPNLTTISYNGRAVDVVVQTTKDGQIYVLDRDNGTSLFPVEERAVPTNGVPGELPFPVQKYPLKPEPFTIQEFSEDAITNISPESHDYVKKILDETGVKRHHKFSPPNTQAKLLFGYGGGAEWGGSAIDPDGVLYFNSNHNVSIIQITSVKDRDKELSGVSAGKALYLRNCSACHGQEKEGTSEFPNLRNIRERRTEQSIKAVVKTGAGRMPSFQHLSKDELDALVKFVLNNKTNNEKNDHIDLASRKKTVPYDPPYTTKTWKQIMDKDNYPGVKPPWGTLNALDLSTGEYLWRVPLGEYEALTRKGVPVTGTENFGGPLVTASGLIF